MARKRTAASKGDPVGPKVTLLVGAFAWSLAGAASVAVAQDLPDPPQVAPDDAPNPASPDLRPPPPDDVLEAVPAPTPLPTRPPPAGAPTPSLPPAAPSAAWLSVGPGPTTDGQVEGLADGEVIGSVHVVRPHPTDADILYIGAVNGGVWKSVNATAASPSWTPLTDDLPSLSISAVEFDPTDPSFDTLVAATGTNSSYGSYGGAKIGLLRTTDGGANWSVLDGGGTLAGADITGVAVRGQTIVVSVDFADNYIYPNVGVFRSVDGGASFVQVSVGDGAATGLPGGIAYDLGLHPDDPTVLYTNINFADAGGANGLYRSADTGASWTKVSDAAIDAELVSGDTSNVEFAVHHTATDDVVYAAILNFGQLIEGGVFRSADQGATWTRMDTPTTNETDNSGGSGQVGTNPRFKPTAGGPSPNSGEPGGQGAIHFAIVADPSDPDIVYIGGDRQPRGLNDTGSFPNSIGAENFTGRLFRGDASVAPNGNATAPSPQWEHLTHVAGAGGMPGGGTASGSAPHADAREMAFDINGDLIESDDGGVYRRTSPGTNTGDWFSLNGDLRVTELHDIAYDTVSGILFGGAQDTGTPEQANVGDVSWFSVSTADGGDVAVDLADNGIDTVRYSSFQNLGAFRRRTFDPSNNLLGTEFPPLTVTSGQGFVPAFVTPLSVNALVPGRLIIVGRNGVYESFDRGDSIKQILNDPDLVFRQSAIAYGGVDGATAEPDVLYVGIGGSLYVRGGTGAPLLPSTGYPGSTPRDVVMHPEDWRRAWTADDSGIFQTLDGGASWSDVTGDFADVRRNTIAFAPCGLDDCLYVGGSRGVYQSSAAAPGAWVATGTGLPNVLVEDLIYDEEDALLVIGTMGRGAWTYTLEGVSLTCNGQAVTVSIGQGEVPTSGDDVVLGTAGPDVIAALGGNDTVCAGGGADVVDGGGGDDWIDGGAGPDEIAGAGGNDLLFGGDAADEIDGGGGDDEIYGEAGDDSLKGRLGEDLIDGGPGVDEINGGPQNDTIYTGLGATVGAGVFVIGGGGSDTIFGGADADDLRGGAGADFIYGNGNDDRITGGAGRDELYGGDGDDDIRGQEARDRLFGDAGDDDLSGGPGDDRMDGGSGTDICNGQAGDNDSVLDCETVTGIPGTPDVPSVDGPVQ